MRDGPLRERVLGRARRCELGRGELGRGDRLVGPSAGKGKERRGLGRPGWVGGLPGWGLGWV